MALVKSIGNSDTAIAGVSSLNFPRGLVNFGADFREKSDNPGKEIVLTNITCPIDQPEKFRLSYSLVKNIYDGTEVDSSLMAPSKGGVSVLCQLTEVMSVTDSATPDFNLQLPVSYHVVIKVPRSGYVTSSDIMTGLGRLVSGLFDTGSTSISRLDAILRGSLCPTDL